MCSLDCTFNKNFQTSVMDDHMKHPLFKDEQLQVEGDSNEKGRGDGYKHEH
jgi:hypothetical protein